MTALKENLEQLETSIAEACRNAGRNRGEVELMAVSKSCPAATLVEAAALGLTLFGENRVQEFAAKAPELAQLRPSDLQSAQKLDPAEKLNPVKGTGFSPYISSAEPTGALAPEARPSGSSHSPSPSIATNPIRVHLIGHLQSNKALRAVELFDGIDTLDSLRLAERLNETAAKLGKRLPVLLEIKLSPEESKAGLLPESAEAAELLERLPDLAYLQMRGLMTIAPFDVPESETRACFRALRGWRERWASAYPRLAFDVLSMGMSADFALAIEEGATRVRIGTALFGARSPYTGAA
jgi:hypothetical protein